MEEPTGDRDRQYPKTDDHQSGRFADQPVLRCHGKLSVLCHDRRWNKLNNQAYSQ
jgi:hypothetical protein